MIKKPTIAWLHTHICYWNGGTKFIYRTTSELRKFYDITLFIEDYDKNIKADFERNHIKVMRSNHLSSNKLLYWVMFPFILLNEYMYFNRVLKEYDYVISSMFPMNILANLTSRQKHAQFIFEPFAFFHDREMVNGYSFVKKLALKFIGILYSWLDILFTQKSKQILTVNKNVSDWIYKIYKKKSSPSYLIIDSSVFRPMENKYFGNKYASNKIVLHTTDYTPIKRTDFMINTFADVVKEYPGAVLCITHTLDDPNKRKELKLLCKKLGIERNVNFLGFVKNEDIPKLYSSVNCGVYPGIGSGASACSYFVLEMMSCATPVVRTSDSTEEIDDGVSGYLFDPQNGPEMVSKLVNILKNNNLSKEMGIQGRAKIKKIYSADNVVNNFNTALKVVKYIDTHDRKGNN